MSRPTMIPPTEWKIREARDAPPGPFPILGIARIEPITIIMALRVVMNCVRSATRNLRMLGLSVFAMVTAAGRQEAKGQYV